MVFQFEISKFNLKSNFRINGLFLWPRKMCILVFESRNNFTFKIWITFYFSLILFAWNTTLLFGRIKVYVAFITKKQTISKLNLITYSKTIMLWFYSQKNELFPLFIGKNVFLEEKPHFFGSKTVDQRSGANSKNLFFAKIWFKFLAFFKK